MTCRFLWCGTQRPRSQAERIGRLEHKHKLTPYHGMKMKGKIVATYLRGEKIYSSSDERGKYPHNHRAVALRSTPAAQVVRTWVDMHIA